MSGLDFSLPFWHTPEGKKLKKDILRDKSKVKKKGKK